MTLTLRYESPRDAQASKTPGSASRSGSWRRCRANWPSADRPTVSPAAPASWHRTGTAATLLGTVQQPTSDPNGRSSYEAGPHRNGRSVLSYPSEIELARRTEPAFGAHGTGALP